MILSVLGWWLTAGSAIANVGGRNVFNQREHIIKTTKVGEIIYVSLADIQILINAGLEWNPFSGTAKVDTGDRIIKVSMYSPYVMVDNDAYNMVYSAAFQDGELYMPLESFLELSNKVLRGELVYDYGQERIDYVPRFHNILGLSSEERTNASLITVSLSEAMQYEYNVTDEGWLNLIIDGGRVDTNLVKQWGIAKAVQAIRAYQFENSAQLSFRLKEKNASIKVSDSKNPARIIISISAETDESEFSGNPSWRKNEIELIVIDPGHGGQDSGAVGRKYGTKEKDVVLEISKMVAKFLENKGLKVMMTRNEDVFIPLGGRTQLANRLGADLFVSIHANASPKRKPRGSQTFFLSQAKNDEARAAAALENSSLKFEMENEALAAKMGDLDYILMDLVQNEYLKESSELAEMIQKEADGKLKIPNRGIDQAGFYVLNKAYMPAVLVETAFISNEVEEGLLKKESFQKKVAENIANGILEFKRKYQLTKK